ncbi:hypothetical protein GGH91_006200, partial [Coemansia sp. RSA 2671]
MDSNEISFVLCSIDSLTKENRELRTRLEAVEQTTGRLATSCDDDTVEPLASKRLDHVRRIVSAFEATWEDLRQLYPPRQSVFALLTEVNDDLETDFAFSQAATMAAYGVELLRVALS